MAQCTAKAKSSGERCRRAALNGSNVCLRHGAAAPQVREKARQRVLAMVDPALARLRKIIVSGDSLDADAIRAARDILNRAGIGENTAVDSTGPITINIAYVDKQAVITAEAQKHLSENGVPKTAAPNSVISSDSITNNQA